MPVIAALSRRDIPTPLPMSQMGKVSRRGDFVQTGRRRRCGLPWPGRLAEYAGGAAGRGRREDDRMTSLSRRLLLATLPLSPAVARAQPAAPFPTRTVRIVVGFTPGGATDELRHTD